MCAFSIGTIFKFHVIDFGLKWLLLLVLDSVAPVSEPVAEHKAATDERHSDRGDDERNQMSLFEFLLILLC